MLTASPGTDRKINVNGITISYEDSGISGVETIPLIFIHGFPFNKAAWYKQFDFFKQVCRVITYDIRGYGETSQDHNKPTLDLYADDLIKFMDALKIERAMVCGLSMGGYILLNALERYPERFEAAILSDTQASADSIEAFDKRHFAIQQLEAGGINEFALAQLKKVLSAETLNQQKDLVEQIRRNIVSTPPKTIIGTLNALLQRKDMTESLKKISVPTLVICGKEDTVTPVVQAEKLAKNIPDASIQIIAKASHLANIDQPEEFNKQVNRFISKVLDR